MASALCAPVLAHGAAAAAEPTKRADPPSVAVTLPEPGRTIETSSRVRVPVPEQVAAVDGARGTGRSRFIELTETVTIRGLTWSETTAAGGPSRDAIASPVAAAVAAGGCFEATIKYGNTGMWGYMKQTWCNNGATVTYFPDSICWGSSSWPTYNYMGCSRSNTFGAGWTFGRSTVSWHMCISYVPIWGACAWSIARTETWQVNQSNSLMSRISVSGP